MTPTNWDHSASPSPARIWTASPSLGIHPVEGFHGFTAPVSTSRSEPQVIEPSAWATPPPATTCSGRSPTRSRSTDHDITGRWIPLTRTREVKACTSSVPTRRDTDTEAFDEPCQR